MFRYFHTHDFNPEIEKEAIRTSHLIQIYTDEFGFLRLEEPLLNKLKEGVNVELVVISPDKKKSIKLVNLAKRIIDLNGEIFFIHDKKIFDLKDFFGIFDKTYLISKLESKNFISNESLIREKNSFFEILSVKSNLIDLYSGNIDVFFKSDKTVLRKGESFELNWNVDNAHEVSINNDVGIVSNKGSIFKSVDFDTKFELTAKNKDFEIKKSVYIKIFDDDEISIFVKVHDKTLDRLIEVSSIRVSKFSESYAVFDGQIVELSWDISTNGRFSESALGDLDLRGSYRFKLDRYKCLIFNYLTVNNKKTKKIEFHGFNNKKNDIERKSFLKWFFDKLIQFIRKSD